MTLPAFRQRVQTYTRFGAAPTRTRTFWRLGSKRRLVATIEWLRLFPKLGPFPQLWQTLAMRRASVATDGPGYHRPRGVSTIPAHIQLPARYRVTRRIATGGMASVYAAEDSVLGRPVAIKILAE